MRLAFDAPPAPTVAIADDAARFPVRRIFCVGRNYAEHAREMGGDPDRDPPFFFTKPADAVVDAGIDAGGRVPYPPRTDNFHHEVEMVIALSKGGADVPTEDVLDLVFGYAVAVDLTRRDLQRDAKAAGRPWDMSKGFDHAAPLAPIARASDVGHLAKGRIWLDVNGESRQDADLAELVWSVPELLATLSTYVTLAPGDLVFTGTPAGVGPLERGDAITAGIVGLPELRLEVK